MIEKIRITWEEGFDCYDVEINDPDTTVDDFERACEEAFSGENAKRKYGDKCIGCSICCSERIPVTRIDMHRLYVTIKGKGKAQEGGFQRWLRDNLSVNKYGKCLDVTLRLGEVGICNYWMVENGICTVYEYRPFACRTYLCAPVSRQMEELRSRIINRGQDELVAFLYDEIEEGYRMDNPFLGADDYGDIRLRDVCSKRLWRLLMERDDD